MVISSFAFVLLFVPYLIKWTFCLGVSQVTSQESLPAPKVTLFRNEDVRVGWKGQVPIGTGMVNMGNTCYMNSTLQVKGLDTSCFP